MDLTPVLAWIVAANTIITFANTAYNLLSTRATKALEAIKGLDTKIANLDNDLDGKIGQLNKELHEKISKLADDRKTHGEAIVGRFALVESRLLKIEAELEHLPDRKQAQQAQEQAHRLELAIEKLTGRLETLDERMTGRMDTLDERMKPVAATTARLQNYLMEKGAEE